MIGFWIFMLVMDLLVPSVMIGFGKLFPFVLDGLTDRCRALMGQCTGNIFPCAGRKASGRRQDNSRRKFPAQGGNFQLSFPLKIEPTKGSNCKRDTTRPTFAIVSISLPMTNSMGMTDNRKKQHKQERRNHAEATGNPMEQKNLRRICSLKRIADNQSVKQRTLSLYGEFY